ncbi:FAD-binding oxidoreductase [Thermasporomyces composti]|uniref:FAD/FMN-containing dehydrogenase n=1 Tax=Thermasporomyces composti TaxID=696763 RepID=A0A3D9VGH8_THECX|nr:FAD-binding oxidoreductase [Thermasporomyces composti]REF38255.1 FAD/FMN-containing dehydrogenase [Thermasporomyces composti]
MTGGRVGRRALLGAAALAGASGLVGCGTRSGLWPGDGGTSAPTPLSTPTPGDWNALAESIAGKLLRPGDAGYDEAHQLYDPAFDGTEPAAVAQCKRPADVAAVLEFAQRFGLPVTSRSGGHSYVGASTNQGGIVIDVRPINSITWTSSDVAMVGAGANLQRVYSVLAERNRLIPAGSCPSVGVAGLTLGGGFGLGTRAFGLTCDVVEQVQIVTADGKVRIANETENPDLFWACRGGGGGTFGVVTAFWFRTVPSPFIGTFRAAWDWPHVATVIEGWQRFLKNSSDEVWTDLFLEADPNGDQSVHVFGLDITNDPEPQLTRLLNAVGVDPVSQSMAKDETIGPSGSDARTVFYAGSDVLGGPIPSSGLDGVIAAMNKAAASRLAATALFDSLGGAVSRIAVDATAFPWRKAFVSIQWYAEPGRATPRAARDWIAVGHRAVAPWSVGAYVNYLEAIRTNGRIYFGPNLDRLREVKATYDPNDVFVPPYSL